ncbi:MAG: TROVE domain-containing protein [Bacteroidales bacterium]|nr:TROVE domain-containing protein [Bacteroidales bacterium]
MKFNFIIRSGKRTVNHEAAAAYRLSSEWRLYTAAVTSTLSDNFYETAGERLETIRSLVAECDPLFVARLAVYIRKTMNMRSIPLVLCVELAKIHHGDSLVSRMVASVVQRADEITELLAYYQIAGARTGTKKLNRLSKQLQAGLQSAFNRFDEYQFAKYNRDADIKLRDALFLTHPKAKNGEQQALFDKIANDTLPTPYTWETELSALGQNNTGSEEERETNIRLKWEELIDSRKIGYMALLRNLRNILEANVSHRHIWEVAETLASPDAISRSKQLPFRYLASYREIESVKSGYTGYMLDALEQAATAAAGNIEGFGKDTSILIACDVSGSMYSPVSAKSKIMTYDIGLMLAMLLKARCSKIITGIFGDIWRIINVPSGNILSGVGTLYSHANKVGYATNAYLVVKDLLRWRKKIDKIMFFTDCQMWNNRGDTQLKEIWEKYKTTSPHSKLYLFDLSGYGNTPLDIIRDDVFLIAGWSEKIFDILAAVKQGNDALGEICKTELYGENGKAPETTGNRTFEYT